MSFGAEPVEPFISGREEEEEEEEEEGEMCSSPPPKTAMMMNGTLCDQLNILSEASEWRMCSIPVPLLS